MKKFIIEFNDLEPKYIQIANHIKKLINEKNIDDGEKLPPIRNLAKELSVNTVTIVSAYKKLNNEGYAYQKMGSGTFAKRKELSNQVRRQYIKEIREIKSKAFIDFTGESSDKIQFPIDDLKEIINIILNRDGSEALISKEPLGYLPLRKTLNKVFWDTKLDYNTFIIVSGAQQAIDIASKALLNINDNVVVEKPTYLGALSVFKWRRAKIFEVDMDNDGINIKELEVVIKKNRIRLVYIMSSFHNPTGINYSLEKKLKLLELAEKYDFYILEDDYLGELNQGYFTNLSIKTYDKYDRVIYIKSFSKIFLPGIRLGYMIYPNKFLETMQNTKINTDMATSTLMQRALELYIKDNRHSKHLELIRKEYYEKYIFVKNILDNDLKDQLNYIDPKGGLGFYLMIKDKRKDSIELFSRLKELGVYITPGTTFYNNQEEGKNEFRIIFAHCSIDEIKEGLMKIKEVLEKWNTSL